jgi:hypothetical protein
MDVKDCNILNTSKLNYKKLFGKEKEGWVGEWIQVDVRMGAIKTIK